MARNSPSGSARKRPNVDAKGGSLLWLQGLLCGVLAALATPTALLLAVLLAPGLLSVALDRAPGRPVARTLLLFGLSTTVQPLLTLWKAGHTLDVALGLAFEPATLAASWAAAAAGWLLLQFLPLLVRLALESAALSRKHRLRQLKERCTEEWGYHAEVAEEQTR